MAILKQALASAALVAGGLAATAALIPSTRPALSILGVMVPLERLGLVTVQSGSATAAPGGKSAPVDVVTRQVTLQVADERVTALGSVHAVHAVSLVAGVSGKIVALPVASGESVKAGDTVARLDSEAARLALDKARLALRDAQETIDRLARLKSSGVATAQQMQEANLALDTAAVGLSSAEYDLSQRRIVTPIDGTLGILPVDLGGRVTSETEIARVEDVRTLIVDFRVPERVAGVLKLSDRVAVSVLAGRDEVVSGTVTALDNRLDEASRSLRVQAAIANSNGALRSGMAVRIGINVPGKSFPTVDALAVQWDSAGAYVWVSRDDKAQKVPVRIVQRNTDEVLVDGALHAGDWVVSEGVQALRPGSALQPRPVPKS